MANGPATSGANMPSGRVRCSETSGGRVSS